MSAPSLVFVARVCLSHAVCVFVAVAAVLLVKTFECCAACATGLGLLVSALQSAVRADHPTHVCLSCGATDRVCSHVASPAPAPPPRMEIFNAAYKVTITGVLVFIAAGTATQVVVALLVALVALAVQSETHPYLSDGDNRLASLAHWGVALALLGGLFEFVDRTAGGSTASPQQGSVEQVGFDAAAVVVTVSVFVVGVFIAIDENLLGRYRGVVEDHPDAVPLERWLRFFGVVGAADDYKPASCLPRCCARAAGWACCRGTCCGRGCAKCVGIVAGREGMGMHRDGSVAPSEQMVVPGDAEAEARSGHDAEEAAPQPWSCVVCGRGNTADAVTCVACRRPAPGREVEAAVDAQGSGGHGTEGAPREAGPGAGDERSAGRADGGAAMSGANDAEGDAGDAGDALTAGGGAAATSAGSAGALAGGTVVTPAASIVGRAGAGAPLGSHGLRASVRPA